jgi:hypothetical protein
VGKYDAQAATALALVRRKGAAVTLTRESAESFDPVNQTGTSTSTLSYYGIGMPPGKSAEFAIGTLEGRNILEFYLAPSGHRQAPQPGDTLSWAGATWKIIHVTAYDPAGDGAILFKAYAQR